tara:strand:- start:3070 stop:4473 length:1404 start_codon:yes stop_codon:yes gene_type:complete
MSNEEVTITLRVPLRRANETSWLHALDSDHLVDVLNLCKMIHESSKLGETQSLMIEHNEAMKNEKEASMKALAEKDELCNTLRMKLARLKDEHFEAEKEQLNKQNEMQDNQIQRIQELCANQIAFIQSQSQNDNDRIQARFEAENERLQAKITHLEARLQNKEIEANKRLSELEPLLQDSVAALKSFSTDARNGIVGEQLVQNVFNDFNVGFLEDLRYSKEPGSEDYLWTLPDEKLKCSIEVKWVSKIHNQHDMNKHITRIQEAQRMNKINCGLFLSLRSSIPNTKQFEIKLIHQTPVLYVSAGGGNSQMAPQHVAEIGFKMMKALWPFLNSTTQQDGPVHDQVIFSHISELFERQFHSLNLLSTEIQSMTRQIAAIHRSIEKLDSVKAKMLQDILNVQIEHPILESTKETNSNDIDLVTMVLNYLHEHKKYPKSREDFADPSAIPEDCDFEQLVRQAKKKRKLSSS